MERIAQFYKVSEGQFAADLGETVFPHFVHEMYEAIELPRRATAGSAGYDIRSPYAFSLEPGQTIRVATGLRCRIDEGWVLFVLPKSGLGFRFRVQLDNTVGVVDADYFGAENEGHILVQITNDSRIGRRLEIPAGKAFAQAVFLPFGITEDDEAAGLRTGGFGSTGA